MLTEYVIKVILSEQSGISIDAIKPESDLEMDLGLDSLDQYEVLLALEEEMGIDIPDVDFLEVKTVGGVFDFCQKLGAPA